MENNNIESLLAKNENIIAFEKDFQIWLKVQLNKTTDLERISKCICAIKESKAFIKKLKNIGK